MSSLSAAAPVDGITPGALRRYQVMAYVVGIGLLVLCLVGIPLQLAGHKIVVEVVGPVHGYLYIVYLMFAMHLAFQAWRARRISVIQFVAMLAAGLLPVLAFVIERNITRTLCGSGNRTLPAVTPPRQQGDSGSALSEP